MMDQKQYVFPARFVSEDNGTVSVYFPDLDGCQTYDDTMSGAAIMAKDAQYTKVVGQRSYESSFKFFRSIKRSTY